MKYGLINTQISAPLIKIKNFTEGEQPPLLAQKGLKWIPDNVPAYNSRTQTLTQVSTIPIDAAEVPYTVKYQPNTNVFKLIKNEAYRRIINIFGADDRNATAKQRNLISRAIELTDKGRVNWTQAELAEWNAGNALWARVKNLRNDSNNLETLYTGMSNSDKNNFNPSDNIHWSE